MLSSIDGYSAGSVPVRARGWVEGALWASEKTEASVPLHRSVVGRRLPSTLTLQRLDRSELGQEKKEKEEEEDEEEEDDE
eukprot:1838630-Pyramimonas_sp.AAC.1